jgi:hypothetical protein
LLRIPPSNVIYLGWCRGLPSAFLLLKKINSSENHIKKYFLLVIFSKVNNVGREKREITSFWTIFLSNNTISELGVYVGWIELGLDKIKT